MAKTKFKSLKQFCEASHIDAKLIRSTVRQMGGWESFSESAEDVSNHGAGTGWNGFTYYSDTVAFTKRNKSLILELAKDLASQFGDVDEYQMIANFNCLRSDYSVGEVASAIHNPKDDGQTTVMNALAWFVLEEVARSYCDLCDQ